MRPLREVTQEVTAAIASRLMEAAFTRRRNEYRLSLGDDITGSIDLGGFVRPSENLYVICPSVAIVHLQVERLVTKWWPVVPKSPRPELPSLTAVQHLGYLMPESSHRSWYFSPQWGVGPGVEEFVGAALEYGVPWMRKMADLRVLVAWLVENEGMRQHAFYAIPAIYFLLGEEKAARVYIGQVLREIERRGPSYFWSGFTIGWPQDYIEVMSKL